MAIPREPRQKMINLMYLVLTALLALNVSSEILNGFRTVNNRVNSATRATEQKNLILMDSLQASLNDPKTRERAAIWLPRAQKAQKLSDDMYAYIDGLKKELLRASGYRPEKGDSSYLEDEVDASTKIMDEGKAGDTLHQKLVAYKDSILAISTEINDMFKNSLPLDLTKPIVEDKSNNTWSAIYFRMMPTIAAITILSQFQNDVKNSEAQVVGFCYDEVGHAKVVYNQFEPLATSNSAYYFPGQDLIINAGLGAFTKSARPVITIDGSAVPIDSNGVATYKSVAGSPGNYTRRINITFIRPDNGALQTVTKIVQYTVGSPTGVTISADATRVLYIGLDNPISVAGANGRGAEMQHVTIDQGTITSVGAGKYIARVNRPGTAHITVSDGKTQVSQEMRVKTVPDPIAMVGNLKSGRARLNDIIAQTGVRAELENFVFEGVKFTVTGYSITCMGAGFPDFMHRSVNGNSFSSIQDLFQRAKPGCKLIFDDIRATGPGGSRSLPPLVFNTY